MKLNIHKFLSNLGHNLKDAFFWDVGDPETLSPEEGRMDSWKRRYAELKEDLKSEENPECVREAMKKFLHDMLYSDYCGSPSQEMAEFIISFCEENFEKYEDSQDLFAQLSEIPRSIPKLAEDEKDNVALALYKFCKNRIEIIDSEYGELAEKSYYEFLIEDIIKALSVGNPLLDQILVDERARRSARPYCDEKILKIAPPGSKVRERILEDALRKAESINGQQTKEQIYKAMDLCSLFSQISGGKSANFDGRVHLRFMSAAANPMSPDTFCIFNTQSGAKPVFFGAMYIGPVEETREHILKTLEREDMLKEPIGSRFFVGRIQKALEGSETQDVRTVYNRLSQIMQEEGARYAPACKPMLDAYRSALEFIDEVCPPAV